MMKLKSTYSLACIILLASFVALSACQKSKEEYNVSKLFSEKTKQDSLLLQIVTIIEEHMPDSVAKADRFKPEQQTFFKSKIEVYKFEYLYKNENGEYFYYVTKPAYGVPELSVGLAGKFKIDAKQHIIDFEESYRLFRMPPEELDKKSWLVYQDFVQGKDLSAFHKDLNEDPYIEFPNEHVAYDKQKLEWYIVKPY